MSVNNQEKETAFDINQFREREQKFIPLFPGRLEHYRQLSYPIEQFYLSHPSELFSLRFREALLPDGTLTYEATLKDNGTVYRDGIDRLEVTIPVSAELYQYYQSAQTPVLRKLRAEPIPGVVIDFYEDGSCQVESEDPLAWRTFLDTEPDQFIEITGDRQGSNEWRAHLSFRRAHDGKETLCPEEDLHISDIVTDILNARHNGQCIHVHIGGRSGSGKSTIVNQLRSALTEHELQSAVLSTDDYHRGATALAAYNGGEPWTHWDDPLVYDTGAMAIDLAHLRSGHAIYRRSIDWTIVEPTFTELIMPADVIIIEGIYARSPDITSEGELDYEMTTSLATCIGRRLLRDMLERPQFADPRESLEYMLREAEPAYRAQTLQRESA